MAVITLDLFGYVAAGDRRQKKKSPGSQMQFHFVKKIRGVEISKQ